MLRWKFLVFLYKDDKEIKCKEQEYFLLNLSGENIPVCGSEKNSCGNFYRKDFNIFKTPFSQ